MFLMKNLNITFFFAKIFVMMSQQEIKFDLKIRIILNF